MKFEKNKKCELAVKVDKVYGYQRKHIKKLEIYNSIEAVLENS